MKFAPTHAPRDPPAAAEFRSPKIRMERPPPARTVGRDGAGCGSGPRARLAQNADVGRGPPARRGGRRNGRFWLGALTGGPWFVPPSVSPCWRLRGASLLRYSKRRPFKLLNSSDPIAQDAIRIRDHYPAPLVTRYGGSSLGGTSIDGACIYPPIASLKATP